MQPLLRIQSIPINIQFSTKRAELRHTTELPRVEVTRTRGAADIRTDPARVKIDSYEMRASMGLKSPHRSIEEFAETGRADAMRAAREFADNGNQIMDSHGKGNPIADIAMTKVMSSYETIMTFIPSRRPEISVEGGNISFNYTPDKLNFNWQVQPKPQVEYIPGAVEFTVSQYPDVVIEYLGGPHYAPPSADPNYVPPPSLDTSA